MGNTPEKKYRMGQITLTVWKNTREVNGKQVDFYSNVIEKNYKDKDDNWKTTSTVSDSELQNVAAVVNRRLADLVKE